MIHTFEHERAINAFQFIDSRSKALIFGVFQYDTVDPCQSHSCAWKHDYRPPHQCNCNATKFCHQHVVKFLNVYEMDTSAVNRFDVIDRNCEDSANTCAKETVCLNNEVLSNCGR